jgi:pimeloyl-ACP methyl ester carboxylesterase
VRKIGVPPEIAQRARNGPAAPLKPRHNLPMNSSRGHFRSGLKLFFAAAIVWTSSNATAADVYVPFEGEKTAWHAGFDRYDFIMDDATGAITPMTAPASEVTSFGIDESVKGGKRRCVVVVPKKAAPGNPWSWRGCYWNHQPQTEVELLRRGFHIVYVAPDPGRQGKAWDVWYKFMTENHGLAKKAAFVGMSKGGVNAFNWGAVNPDKVACIYADNPAVYDEDFAKIPELAKHDVPLLHVVGTEDFVLQRHTMVVERMYHQLGGSITVIMKEGVAHHPHSLIDPTPIADWIEQHMHPVEANRPAFADSTYTKTHYYSLENSLIYLKEEDTYATVRGPGYVPSYDRYDGPGTGNFHGDAMAIVVPQNPAPGKLWVFHPSFLDRDSAVAMALLAKGYYIVLPPISASGAVQKEWDEVYKRMVDNGFSTKVVMEGTGAKAGESYAWAIANPDKVSVIYARNPLLSSLMSKTPPIDNLAPLAKAGVPILHDCGSLDPWLKDQTRVAEKRYKELGGKITVLVTEGEGHFPVSRKDPKPVVDFILSYQR